MTVSEFKSLLDGAAIMASKLESDRIAAVQQYLKDNGIKVSFTNACMFLLGRNISLITEKDINLAFGGILTEEPQFVFGCQICGDTQVNESTGLCDICQVNWAREQEAFDKLVGGDK